MMFYCHECGMGVGNVKSATCSKHGPMTTAPVRGVKR